MTLPFGWVGNEANHHRDIGMFRVKVRRHYNHRPPEFRKLDEVWYWEVWTKQRPNAGAFATNLTSGCKSMEDARDEALKAVRAIAHDIIDALDKS